MTCHYLCPYGPRTLGHQACQECENAIDNLESTRWMKGILARAGLTTCEEEHQAEA